jgi:hypothetical protein
MSSRRSVVNVIALVTSVIALCAWCGWLSGFHRSTFAARATWPFSLAAVVVVDVLLWQGRRGRRPGLRLEPVGEPWPRPGRGGGRLAFTGILPWLVFTLVILTWEILGIDTPKDRYHLTISALSQAFRPLNAALLLLWMLVGFGYGCARARAPVGTGSSIGVGRHGDGTAPLHGAPRPEGPAPLSLGVVPALLLPESQPAGIAFWVGIVAVGFCLDLVARRSDGRLANAEELLRLISTSRVAKVLLVIVWGYAGYHLFAH